MRVLVIGGTRFIGAALVRHLAAMGHTAADGLGWRGEIIAVPDEALRFDAADPHPLIASAERIRRSLGFVPPWSFAEGVARAARYQAQHLPSSLPETLRDYTMQDAAAAARRKP